MHVVFLKEEKKNRIKMEIARRRHQIDENACLHEELSRLAKLREHAEISNHLGVPSSTNLTSNLTGAAVQGGVYGMNPAMAGINQLGAMMNPMSAAVPGHHASVSNLNIHANNPNYLNSSSQLSHTATQHGTGAAGSHLIPTSGVDGTSILKSVDEILRETGGGNPAMTGGLPSANTLLTNHHMNPSAYHNLTNNYATNTRSNQNALSSLHNHMPVGGVDPYSGVGGVGATPTMGGFAHHPATSSYDHRVTDFSPIHSEINELNPLMNDMTISGNRSNRMMQRGTFNQPNTGIM